jgi:hypothetical protein
MNQASSFGFSYAGQLPAAGAAMTTEKWTLQRVRLNGGGYDDRGHYWGVGQPLFWYCSPCGQIDGHLRAPRRYRDGRDDTRGAAKDAVRALFPHAQFYR